jgi:hypothetical protein
MPRTTEWTQDKIIEAIKDWAGIYGGPPAASDWRKPNPGYPSASTVKYQFGSWSAGIKAAGFKPKTAGRPPNKRKRNTISYPAAPKAPEPDLRSELAELRKEIQALQFGMAQDMGALVRMTDQIKESVADVRSAMPTHAEQRLAIKYLADVLDVVSAPAVVEAPERTANGNGHHQEEARGIIARLFG